MKKSILFICILLAFAIQAEARGIVMVGGQKAVSGGSAASGIYRPNGDVSIASWTDNDYETSSLYTEIDDAVDTGTNGDGAVVHEWETQTTYTVAFPEVTGTINTVRVHYRAMVSGTTNTDPNFQVSRDGTNWTSSVSGSIGHQDSMAWNYVDFTGLSWDGTTDLQLRIIATYVQVYQFDVVYIQVNP